MIKQTRKTDKQTTKTILATGFAGLALFGLSSLNAHEVLAQTTSTTDNDATTSTIAANSVDKPAISDIQTKRSLTIVYVDQDENKNDATQAFLDTQSRTITSADGKVSLDVDVPAGYELRYPELFGHISTYLTTNQQKVVYVPVVHKIESNSSTWLDYTTKLDYQFFDENNKEIYVPLSKFEIAWLKKTDLATNTVRYIPYSKTFTGVRLFEIPQVVLPTLVQTHFDVKNGQAVPVLAGFLTVFKTNLTLVNGALLEIPPKEINVTVNEKTASTGGETTDPGETNDPTDPNNTTDPENPEQPGEGGETTPPTNPVDPTDPTEPVEPTDPEQPDVPEVPVIPEVPEQPVVVPDEPVAEAKPDKKPTAVTKPDKPANNQLVASAVATPVKVDPAASDKKNLKQDNPNSMIAYLGGSGSAAVPLPGGGTESSQLGLYFASLSGIVNFGGK